VQPLLRDQQSGKPRLKAMLASGRLHHLPTLLGAAPLNHNGPTSALYGGTLLLDVRSSRLYFVHELKHLMKAQARIMK